MSFFLSLHAGQHCTFFEEKVVKPTPSPSVFIKVQLYCVKRVCNLNVFTVNTA